MLRVSELQNEGICLFPLSQGVKKQRNFNTNTQFSSHSVTKSPLIVSSGIHQNWQIGSELVNHWSIGIHQNWQIDSELVYRFSVPNCPGKGERRSWVTPGHPSELKEVNAPLSRANN